MKKIFRKETLIALLIIIEIFAVILTVYFLTRLPVLSIGFVAFTFITTLYILSTEQSPEYKLTKLIPMLVFPHYGGIFYLIFNVSKKKREEISCSNISEVPEASLLMNSGFYPCSSPESRYFSDSEELFLSMLEKINTARSFIYIEFFIIAEGKALDMLLSALQKKSDEGVTVKIIYDAAGSMYTKPANFTKRLQDMGIEALGYNPLNPLKLNRINCRDHRKILVIDGKYAFTGGINISDEYMNYKLRFGLWKDTGIMVSGKAAESFTEMFEKLYYSIKNEKGSIPTQKKPYRLPEENELCISFCDSTLDRRKTGLRLYLSLINRARKSIFITTPYLICDDEILNSLCSAAESGVDVRIILPGIPDKKYVNFITKSHYSRLISGGVKIYEFEKGFIHSKTIVADMEKAVVGTINLDYRSFSETLECGCFFTEESIVSEVYLDFTETLRESVLISLQACRRESFFVKVARGFLKLFEPLM